ncbi:MAG TPA: hypothetical protein VL092_01350 [Chitinophagaceae bacterium]|nr:hypothetical protein [Chitinophagaceae bacterium]
MSNPSIIDFTGILGAFLAAATGLALSLGVGYALSRLVSRLAGSSNRNIPMYWLLFCGLFFIVSLYAIIRTGGLSILSPVPLLIAALLYYLHTRPDPIPSQGNRKEESFLLLFSFLAQFVFFVCTFQSFDPQSIKYVAGDFNIYYRMANRLNEFGIEAYNFNITRVPSHPSPYHFGDIWLYALSNRFVSLNPSVSFLTSFSILSPVFTLGMYALVNSIFPSLLQGKKKYLLGLLAFSGLFGGFSICFPGFLRAYAEPYTLAIFSWGKVLLLSTALAGILIACSKRQLQLVVLSACLAGLLYINAIPAIYMSVFFLLTLLLLRKQLSGKQWFRLHVLLVGITVTTVLALYKLYPMLHPAAPALPEAASSGFLHGLPPGKYIKTAINIFIGGWFQVFTILPFLLLLAAIVFFHKGFRSLFAQVRQLDLSAYFLAFLFLSGLISWALLFPLSVDAVQFFHNILAPVYSILITMIVFYTLSSGASAVLKSATVAVALLSVYFSWTSVFYASNANRQDWESARTFFREEQTPPGIVNIKSMNELSYWSAKKTDQYLPLGFLCYLWPGYSNVNLNTPFIGLSDGVYAFEEQKDIEGASFSTFRKKSIEAGLSDETGIINKFLSDYKVRYIFVSTDTALPAYLRLKITDSVLLKNSDFTVYRITEEN